MAVFGFSYAEVVQAPVYQQCFKCYCQLSVAEKAVTRPLERAGYQVNFLDFSPAKLYPLVVSLLLGFFHCFSVIESHLSSRRSPISAVFEARCESVPKTQMKAPAPGHEYQACGYG